MEPQKDMPALGETLRAARLAKGLSARKLAAAAGLTHSFISKLESATYDSVSPDSLMSLARALDLAPEDLFTLAGFRLPDALPSFGPYLRVRYGEELPPGARAALTEVFETLQRQHDGSDRVNDEEDANQTTIGGRS
jgi:transcriptional regulator with XRE-family HTH domain